MHRGLAETSLCPTRSAQLAIVKSDLVVFRALRPIQTRWWLTMNLPVHFAAAVVLVALLAGQSGAQTQNGTPASPPEPAACGGQGTEQSVVLKWSGCRHCRASSSSTSKTTLSKKSRKTGPPPPPHRSRIVKKAGGAYTGSELDPHGRIDMAGKSVRLYPSARGALRRQRPESLPTSQGTESTPKKSQ